MSLPITPEVARSCYAFLAATEPFCRWNLADATDVKFVISASRSEYGSYRHCPGYQCEHEITVSTFFIGRTHMLVEVIAHEMIHLFQRETKMDHHTTQHNAAFKKLAHLVCRHHGFDPKDFWLW